MKRFSVIPIPAIKWEEHVVWFNHIYKSNSDVFYIITDYKNSFLGQIRYKIKNDTAVVSISLCKLILGKGVSLKILKKSIEKLREDQRALNKLIAYISLENIASIKLFNKCGFEFCSKTNQLVRYEYIIKKEQ